MREYKKILFVSETDTAKGPMAAAAFEQCRLERPVEVFSRGLVALFPEPINEKAEAVMISNGVRVEEHASAQLEQEELTEETMVVALERPQFQTLLEKFDDSESTKLPIDDLNKLAVYLNHQ